MEHGMASTEFKLLSFEEAIAELELEAHFGDRMFDQYGEEGGSVRYYDGDGVTEGDVDLDALFYNENVAGIFVRGDLDVRGSILNWEIDTVASFLAVGRDLSCVNLIAGCADIRVRRDLKASGVVVSTYNHGYMEVSRNATAKFVIVDDHHTIIGGKVNARGWKASNEEFDLRDSTWIDEVRPELRDEFFDSDGFQKCPNGNVDLVKALLAGRPILRD
jgi:hypothetical protein